jgi:DNA-binding transcriptional ArsR family regulator
VRLAVFGQGHQLKTFNISVERLPPAHHGRPAIVNKMVEDQVLDRAYAALADPTRRWLLETLRKGDARITDLAAPLPMTFAGVSRHVGVLESAGLVLREVRGREHWLSLRPDGLTMAQQWIDEQTDFWSTRADALSARLRRKRRAQRGEGSDRK